MALTSAEPGAVTRFAANALANSLRIIVAGGQRYGAQFSAVKNQNTVSAGDKLTLVELDSQAHVRLRQANGSIISMTIQQFNYASGEAGKTALLTQVMTEPTFDDDVTYIAPPSNAVFFSNLPGAGGLKLVQQGGVGDCWLDATIAGMLARNESDVHRLVRYSQDRQANHVDSLVYAPSLATEAPKVITITNRLPWKILIPKVYECISIW